MKNYVKIDRLRRRVFIRASGQWTIPDADVYYTDMAVVANWSHLNGEPISVFADLDGLVLHTPEVSARIEEAVALMRTFPLERYSLIVPSFLMRMQCRRLLAGIPHYFHESTEEAMSWLGWENNYALAA